MNDAREAVVRSGVLMEGHFIFANGDHATTKLEMDNLWDHEAHLETVLNLLAEAKGLPPADVIVGVPTGGQRLAVELHNRKLLTIPLIRLERIPGGTKQDFHFCTEEDKCLAAAARSVRIYEDVVTTLSSVAGVARLFDDTRQDIHMLAIWRRGDPQEAYRRGITDHYLIEEHVSYYSPDVCPICSLDASPEGGTIDSI
jgi:orotate phosphoribosyltransferase